MANIRFKDKTQIDTGDISADDILPITDISDATDDKKITIGQVATFTENQNSTVAGTKIFSSGVDFQKGFIAYGQYSPLPTGIGSYVAGYTHPTYGARLLGYNGSAYQDLSIGSMPTAGTFSIKSLANGDVNFGYNINISGNCTANKFYGDGSELSGIVSGVSIFDNKGTITTNITLAENKITTGYFSGTNTITLPTITDTTKQVTCILDFTTATSSQPTITNSNLRWNDLNQGKAPSAYTTTSLSGVHNVLTFKSIWESSTLYWEAEYTTYGGVETTFVQPALSANGTLGGSSFAVSASSEYSGQPAYMASDGNSSTYWLANSTVESFTLYNPNPLKLLSIDFTLSNGGGYPHAPASGTIYGSNDNSNWTILATFTNSVTTDNVVLNFPIAEANRGFYKYTKLYIPTSTGSRLGARQITLNAVYIAQ